MGYIENIIQNNKSLHAIITKLMISLAFVSFLEIIISPHGFNTKEFFNATSLLLHVVAIVTIFLLLLSLSLTKYYQKIESYLLVLTLLCLFIATNLESQNIYFALMSSLVMGGFIFYYLKDSISINLSKKATIIIISVLGFLFVLFVGGLTTLRYLSHYTPNYDFGIFSQMYHYMSKTFEPLTTVERDGLLSHFAVHFSPLLYIVLPFYMLFPSPVTLLFAQAIALALGIIPLYKLSKHYHLSNITIILLVGMYVFLPSLIGGNFYYFHENKLLTVFLLWLFYFIEKNNHVMTGVFALFTMLIKEDAPVYIGFIGLYLLLSNRGKLRGLFLMLGAVIYFVPTTLLMSTFGEGVMTYRYQNFIFGEGEGLLSVIINIFKNPAYLFEQILTTDKLNFLIYMLVPMAVLPLAIKKPARIILLFPMLLINLMSNYQYQFSIGYQYTYATAAFLFYLAIMNVSELSKPLMRKLMVSGVCASVIFFAATHANKLNFIYDYMHEKDKIEIINEGLALIPRNDDTITVKASTFLVTPLWNVNNLYEYNYTKRDTDYVVLDLRHKTDDYKVSTYQTDKYEEVYFVDNVIGIYRKK